MARTSSPRAAARVEREALVSVVAGWEVREVDEDKDVDVVGREMAAEFDAAREWYCSANDGSSAQPQPCRRARP